jgi:hypothetical protein
VFVISSNFVSSNLVPQLQLKKATCSNLKQPSQRSEAAMVIGARMGNEA